MQSSKPSRGSAKSGTANNTAWAALFDHIIDGKPKKAAQSTSRKRKAKVQLASPKRSVTAPVFQIPPLPPPRANSKDSDTDSLSTAESDIDSDVSSTTAITSKSRQKKGRPTLTALDQLTVEIVLRKGNQREYRCAGEGCSATWKPRTRGRVYKHAKNCLKLPPPDFASLQLNEVPKGPQAHLWPMT
ncbi:hypothetical protein EST38_g13919 [Candolleomyces aberdarensis]|uniref:Uncharacterized protein n=1 Tax=Candolleomyces aberdarensis TaxID=2316362 RepID=A0A4Q2D0I9_9AGAR|nr:hypothetical protein EST38_g13919 [Candolleomyces aberdarensis]